MNESDLWIASRRYLLGEIDIKALKAVEKQFNDAYDQALFVPAKRSLRRKFCLWRRKDD